MTTREHVLPGASADLPDDVLAALVETLRTLGDGVRGGNDALGHRILDHSWKSPALSAE